MQILARWNIWVLFSPPLCVSHFFINNVFWILSKLVPFFFFKQLFNNPLYRRRVIYLAGPLLFHMGSFQVFYPIINTIINNPSPWRFLTWVFISTSFLFQTCIFWYCVLSPVCSFLWLVELAHHQSLLVPENQDPWSLCLLCHLVLTCAGSSLIRFVL